MRKILIVVATGALVFLGVAARAAPQAVGGVVVPACTSPYTTLIPGQSAYLAIEQTTGKLCDTGAGSSGGSPLASPVSGQQKTTTSSAALPGKVSVNGWVIKAASTNTGTPNIVCVGDATVNITNDGSGTGYCLNPGEAISFATPNLNTIYIIGSNTTNFVYYGGN